MHTVRVDFSTKGGPRDVKGVWAPAPLRAITWPDGSSWRKAGDPGEHIAHQKRLELEARAELYAKNHLRGSSGVSIPHLCAWLGTIVLILLAIRFYPLPERIDVLEEKRREERSPVPPLAQQGWDDDD